MAAHGEYADRVLRDRRDNLTLLCGGCDAGRTGYGCVGKSETIRRMDVKIKLADVETDVFLKRCFWLAWQACGGPFNMGVLQDKPTATEDDVFNNVADEWDIPFLMASFVVNAAITYHYSKKIEADFNPIVYQGHLT